MIETVRNNLVSADTVIAEIVPYTTVNSMVEHTVTLKAVAVCETVTVAVNLYPTVLIEVRTVVISCTVECLSPYALFKLTCFIDFIGDTGESAQRTCLSSHSIGIEVVPLVINKVPATLCYTCNEITIYIAVLVKTGCTHFVTARTNHLAVYKCVVVACSRSSGTPIHYGITNCTVGTACVSFLCTGSYLVFYCFFSMNMTSTSLSLVGGIHMLRVSIHLCIYTKLIIRESIENIGCISVNIGDFTHININLNVLWPEVKGIPICLCCITLCLQICVIIYNTDGK